MRRPPIVCSSGSIPELKPHERRLARKALGQHFLTDGSVLQTILSASELGPEDTVVEVGPGLGALTRHLVGVAKKVIAVEKDSALLTSDLRKNHHNM